MSWIPPKTDWGVEDVPGVSFLNRVEGNTAYLKDEIEKGIFFMMPSDTLILQLDATRMVSVNTPTVVKRFRLKYQGVYRITFDLWAPLSNWAVINFANFTRVGYSGWTSFVVDGFLPPGQIEVKLQSSITGERVYLRNLRIKGTLQRYYNTLSDAVLQN